MTTSVASNLIPFVDLKSQMESVAADVDSAIKPILASGGFIMGPAVGEFEKSFAEFCRAKYCVTVNSGTAALHLALLALGIGPGDEVITQPNTFIATAEAISFAGATPRFVDVDFETYNLDVAKLEAAITRRTKAIIPVHLYGQPADMAPIMEIAKKYGIKVIEDACQAHGATYAGKPVGTYGDVAAFSFYPGKNLGAAGDGGAIVTNNPEIAEKVRLLRDHGSSKKYEHRIIGHNFRLDTLQAAILNVKLRHLPAWNDARRRNAAYYTEKLADAAVVTPEISGNCRSVFHLYVIQVDNRAAVQKALTEANIQSGIHYPIPIHLQEAYRFMGHRAGDFPVSERLAGKILSLPMYAELTPAQQDRVIEIVQKHAD